MKNVIRVRIFSFLPWMCLGLILILATYSTAQYSHVSAQEAQTAEPTFTFSALSASVKPDAKPFGLLLEPTRHLTADSQYFYRSAEGLQALKNLGVSTLFYVVDRNNWRALYDDISGAPQPYPAGIYSGEAVDIAKAIGAELVPMLNVTLVCEHIPGTEYTSQNMTCEHAKAKDSVALVKLLKKETKKKGVVFERVVMGLEPYAGCAYWSNPRGVDCTIGNPKGQHRIGLPAEEYAKRVKAWAAAIHKFDPHIKIGAHIQTNTYFCQTGCNRSWSQVVLEDAGQVIDFVLLHQYFRIPLPKPITEQQGQTYSYYQNQDDIIKRKKERTGMPSVGRSEIVKWAPANKKNMPIWYPEFYASILDHKLDDSGTQGELPTDEDFASVRSSVYGGIALGELYLDLLSPVGKGKNMRPGAARAAFHHLFSYVTFLASFQPPHGPSQTMIFTPGWHILQSLKGFAGKEWMGVKAKGIPVNSTGRPSLKAYAARAGKQITVAVFNHETTLASTVDLKFNNLQIRKVRVTRIGDSAASILDFNNPITPDLIVPSLSALPKTQIKKWGIDNLAVGPHSVTVLTITLK